MASLIYDSAPDDTVRGNLNFSSDTYKLMLVTSSYTPNKATDLKRSNVTNEVSGTGYTTGGSATTATITKDTVNHRVDITFSSVSWTTSTITAAAGVIYKSRGGASSADELVAYVDFGGNVTSTAGTFTVTFSSPYRIQN